MDVMSLQSEQNDLIRRIRQGKLKPLNAEDCVRYV